MKQLSAAIILGLALGVLAGQGPARAPLMAMKPFGAPLALPPAQASGPQRDLPAAAPAPASPAAAAPLPVSVSRPSWNAEAVAGGQERPVAARAAREPDGAGTPKPPARGEGSWLVILAVLVAMVSVARRRIAR